METLGFTAVSSRHLSSSPSFVSSRHLSSSPSFVSSSAAFFGSRRVRRLMVSANISSSWIGNSLSLGSCQNNVFSRELWGFVSSKSRNITRDRSFIVRAEMFGQLTSGLEAAWSKLKGEEVLTKENIAEPMRDIRRALLEADVSLPVVRRFVLSVSDQAVGVGLIRGVRPDQQLVKVGETDLAFP